MKAQWARVGVDVTLVPRSAEEAGAEYRNQRYPMYLTFFSGRADPDMTIYENFHSKGSFNRVVYNDAYVPDDAQVALDANIEQARQLYDIEERKPLYDEIQRQIVEDGFGILFTHRTNAVGLTPRVQVAPLAERDQLFHHRAKFLGLGQGGLDLLMLDERAGHVGEHRLAMLVGAVEFAVSVTVTQRRTS